MEILIGILVLIVAAFVIFNRKSLDVNKDGKVDAKDVVEVAAKVEEEVKAEVQVVAKKAKETATKAKAKAKDVEEKVVKAVKKTAAKKPRATKA